jgi:hypothetical protein
MAISSSKKARAELNAFVNLILISWTEKFTWAACGLEHHGQFKRNMYLFLVRRDPIHRKWMSLYYAHGAEEEPLIQFALRDSAK